MNNEVTIVKANGEKEIFSETKLRASLDRSGATSDVVNEIIDEIIPTLKDGMTTQEIYTEAFKLLKKREKKEVAARYSLKRALVEFGPTGFPFEKFVAEIFKAKGYKTETGLMIEGECTTHEIDVLAWNDKEFYVLEAKFHHDLGFRNDLKVALYVKARLDDLHATGFGERFSDKMEHHCGIITNTSFTTNAHRYASCAGVDLIGWAKPRGASLQDLIEETGLHPLTCLTTLSKSEKEKILDQGKVLCRELEDHEILKSIGMSPAKIGVVREEMAKLCIPRE